MPRIGVGHRAEIEDLKPFDWRLCRGHQDGDDDEFHVSPIRTAQSS